MLDMVPALSEDLRSSAELERPIAVRIACDAAKIPSGLEAHADCRRLLARLAEAEHPDGDGDAVTVTARVYTRLARDLRSRFVDRCQSGLLGVELYSTSVFPAEIDTPGPVPSIPSAPPAEIEHSESRELATESGHFRNLAALSTHRAVRPTAGFSPGSAPRC